MSSKKFLLSFFFLIILGSCFSQQNIYVSPNGDDSNGSSLESAFHTIEQAIDLASQSNSNEIIVHIDSGTYVLNSTIQLDLNDSGINNVVYKAINMNEKPIISGGYEIPNQDWSYNQSEGVWYANIGSRYSRQVYVNGQKIIRARSENADDLIETPTGYFSSCNDFSTWGNIEDIEIISNIQWKSSRIPVEQACGNQLMIEENFWRLVHFEYLGASYNRTKPKWIENAYELLDQPNEWYIDRSVTNQHVLYVKINSTSTPPQNVVIPVLEKLIAGDNVSNLEFDGLIFQHTTWLRPSEEHDVTNTNNGLASGQADVHMDFLGPDFDGSREDRLLYQIPGALSFKYSNNITFKNCKFEHIGNAGLEFLVGSKNNTIHNNEFIDIAASAISIGSYQRSYSNTINSNDNHSKMVKNHIITHNLIEDIGNDYFTGVGIFVSFARHSTIQYNRLENFPYSGISVGWGWNNTVTFVGVNDISYNYIECSDQILQDGGGIYTLSNQSVNNNLSSQIHHNYIKNNRIRYGTIYLDQGSSNVDVYDNVIEANNNPSDNEVRWLFIAACYVKEIYVNNNYYSVNQYPPYLVYPYTECPSNSLADPEYTSIDIELNTAFTAPNAGVNNIINNVVNNAGPQ